MKTLKTVSTAQLEAIANKYSLARTVIDAAIYRGVTEELISRGAYTHNGNHREFAETHKLRGEAIQRATDHRTRFAI